MDGLFNFGSVDHVVIVGLSPILTFWMARALSRFLRRKLRQRREVAFRNEHEHSRDEAE